MWIYLGVTSYLTKMITFDNPVVSDEYALLVSYTMRACKMSHYSLGRWTAKADNWLGHLDSKCSCGYLVISLEAGYRWCSSGFSP